MADVDPYRLPRTVEPERYELTLTPDLAAARFTGEENIRVIVHHRVDSVLLNAIELEIFTAEIIDDEGTRVNGLVTLDEETERATIAFDRAIDPGGWTLHLTFAGTLNDKLHGFYRSTFPDNEGNERIIATTQFEATDARRAFPCWDEPDFKAVFSVTLIVNEDLAAFSNAAVREETELGNGKRQVVYEDTMKMSTYLVAFVVGPFSVTEPVDVNGTPLRVACVPGRETLTSFALDVGSAALRYFGEYFKIPYPGGKLDMIAIPDFAFGAMENLGCVTFRETALLVDVERASRMEVQRVADVVAHEIAHMWFGDLVTMKWWNGIWLNEAFATFMEKMLVDHFRPEWERWVTFGMERAVAMVIDGLASTRPVEYPVLHPEEAQGMFDVLTYEKGAAVLRMLEQYLGAHEFSVGIAAYLEDYAYSNAETTDLWDALEKSSDQPVRALMDSWIFQGGYPLIHVEAAADDANSLVLSQRRFRYLAGEDDGGDARWHVPIGIRAMIDNRLHHDKVLLTDERTVVELPGAPDWLVVNERANGFFRVSYEPEILGRLLGHVHALDALERFTLASDTWAACVAGNVDVRQVLDVIEVMKGDDDPNVWGALLAPLRLFDRMVDDATRTQLQAFIRRVVQPGSERLGWEPHPGESERLATLRGVFVATLGSLGADEALRAEALARYDAYQADPSTLDVNLVKPVESVLSATNRPELYELLYAKFTAENSTPQEMVNSLEALASFTDSTLVERTLDMILDGRVRTQDAPYAVRIMLNQRGSGPRVWEWAEQNWDVLVDRFPDNSIVRMLDGITSQSEPELAARVQRFLANHPVPQGQKQVEQVCEKLRMNVALRERVYAQLPELFNLA